MSKTSQNSHKSNASPTLPNSKLKKHAIRWILGFGDGEVNRLLDYLYPAHARIN